MSNSKAVSVFFGGMFKLLKTKRSVTGDPLSRISTVAWWIALDDERLTARFATIGTMTAIAKMIHAATGTGFFLAFELPIQITATTAAVTNAPRANPVDTFVAASNIPLPKSGPAPASKTMSIGLITLSAVSAAIRP